MLSLNSWFLTQPFRCIFCWFRMFSRILWGFERTFCMLHSFALFKCVYPPILGTGQLASCIKINASNEEWFYIKLLLLWYLKFWSEEFCTLFHCLRLLSVLFLFFCWNLEINWTQIKRPFRWKGGWSLSRDYDLCCTLIVVGLVCNLLSWNNNFEEFWITNYTRSVSGCL